MGLRESVRLACLRIRLLPLGGVVSLAAGFLLHLSLGCGYSYGNLTTYLTSYLAVRRGLPVSYGDTLWVDAAMTVAEGPAVFLGSVCYRRLGPRLTLLVGSLIGTGAGALMTVVVDASLAWVIVVYGVAYGFALGLAYSPPLLAGFKWFPNHKGLVSGLVVAGFRLGGIMFTTIQTSFLNPDNVTPNDDDGFFYDDDLLDRVPQVFLVQAAVCAGLQVIGILGVHDPPPSAARPSSDPNSEHDTIGTTGTASTMEMQCVVQDTDRQSADESTDSGTDSASWIQSLKTVPVLQLTISFAMSVFTISIFNPLWKAFGLTFIGDDHFLEMVASGAMVFGLIGRLAWGVLCDIFSFKPIMLLMTGLLSFFLFTLPAASVGMPAMFQIWVWAIFFCYSGSFSVVVTGTADRLGTDSAGHVYGVIFMLASLLSPLAPLLADLVLELRGYPAVFLLAGGFSTAGFVATLTFRHVPRTTEVNYRRMHMPTKS